MRLIDADELRTIKSIQSADFNSIENIQSWIDHAPTVFVECFRCGTFMQPKAEPRWIPVTERLPEKPFGCLVTIWDTNPITMDEFENILPYFVGWDGSQWNDADGEQCPFEVIAWMPLPEPYREVEE